MLRLISSSVGIVCVEEAPITVHQFNNGITLLGQQVPYVSSAALSILVPVGAGTDPVEAQGLTSILVQMFDKGAGSWSGREISQQFEAIGAHQSHVAGIEVSVFSAAVLGDNIERLIELYGTLLLKPTLPANELESIQDLQLQELGAIEDQPSSKVMVELAKKFYPEPFGRCQLGTLEGVKSVTIDLLNRYYANNFHAEGVIIAVSGKFNWEGVKTVVERCFSSWGGNRTSLPEKKLPAESSTYHLAKETSQLQIALAYPSVAVEHPQYYAARVAISVLAGGMAGRLFVEVREKRGLVYRVSASHSATKGRAAIFAYAGTTPQQGEETLQVMVKELKGIAAGVSAEELERAKADLKSKLIIQGESTSARASALVNDWWNLRRVRTLQEIKSAINGVTSDDIIDHARKFPVFPVTLVTLGTKPLRLPT